MKKIIILTFLIVLLAGCAQTECSEQEECPEIVEKAMMSYEVIDWGINMYKEDEALFTVDLYNYGYVEGKNIEVECELYLSDDEGFVVDETPKVTATETVGNIASTSVVSVEISGMGANVLTDDDYYVAFCEIISCDDCEILDQRIS